MTAPLKAFMVYLDPKDPDDRVIINHLKPLIRRRKVSNEIREALIVYLAYLRRRKEPDGNALAGAIQRERFSPAVEMSPTINEAARTFIKRKD